jgi:hypothetical protein
MFMSQCLNHTKEKFRIWDPDTNFVHLSCEIVWTGRINIVSMQQMLEGPITTSILENKNNNEINYETNNEKKK